jgi:tetratricopeptide (TPR) repeat protein
MRAAALAALAALALAAAPSRAAAQELKGPAAEVRPGPQLAVPVVPTFELPPEEPGYRNVRELRVRGQHEWLGTEITVKGHITWVYDCVKANMRPGQKPAEVQKWIDADPTLCERPKFYLGNAKDTAPDRSIWVVDVPRPPNKLERQRLKPEELSKWPTVPKYALGDHVEVTGTWQLQSPHGDRNSDGLLIFKSMQPARATPQAASRATPAPTAQPEPPARKLPRAPPPTPTKAAKRQQSIKQSNQGAKALGQAQFETAIHEYKASVASWPDNHAAWYYLAYAYTRKGDWATAATMVVQAIRLVPDGVMYRMLYGICLYEAAVQRAREALAASQGRKPEEVTPDLRSINQDAALAQLDVAIHLNKDLWRAHYYRGRIYRDRGDAITAATSFSKAVHSAPPVVAPYVALAELYRRWDYVEQAIVVARQGADNIADPIEKGDAYYVLGMAYDDKHDDAGALDAYTNALMMKRDLAAALFQRGQLHARMKNYAAAKADLEAFLARPDTSGLAFARSMAQKLLMDLAARSP